MSFYSGARPGIFPGSAVNGNILNGLCERVCIQVKKVFDSCINQCQYDNLTLVATNYNPPAPVFPLTFISASSTNVPPIVQNVVITRFDDRPNFARVQAEVVIPLRINYTDANGVPGTADSSVVVIEDVVLYVPQPALVPFVVDAFASFIATIGTYVEGNNFQVTACVSVIIKIVADVDILVPSYGYCPMPPCTPYTGDEVCPGVFELPIFPTAVSPPETR